MDKYRDVLIDSATIDEILNEISGNSNGVDNGGGGENSNGNGDNMDDARIARLESDVSDIKADLRTLDTKFEIKFNALDTKFENKFNTLDAKISSLDAKISSLDTNFDSKFESLVTTINNQKYWYLGVIIAVALFFLALLHNR